MLKIQRDLRDLENKNKALNLSKFFKTGPGQYGEGDEFLGITVPVIRSLVRQNIPNLELEDAKTLLSSKWHEERFAGLVIMIHLYKRYEGNRRLIFNLYKSQISKGINNWDLVDISAEHIFGSYTFERLNDPIDELLKLTDGDLWQKRVAIVSTFYSLRKLKDVGPTIIIAQKLVYDDHDLIHKAVGWLLREAGKLDMSSLRGFLLKYASSMPRTMLRYAIEKMDKAERHKWMNYE